MVITVESFWFQIIVESRIIVSFHLKEAVFMNDAVRLTKSSRTEISPAFLDVRFRNLS